MISGVSHSTLADFWVADQKNHRLARSRQHQSRRQLAEMARKDVSAWDPTTRIMRRL